MSGLQCCASGFQRVVYSCLECTGKPQPCLAAGPTKLDWLVPPAMAGDIPPPGEKAFAVQDMVSQHVGSWAASPQTPFPRRMGTSQPATGFYSEKRIPPLEALLCRPGLQMNLPVLSFFSGEKGTRVNKSYTCKAVLCSFGTLFNTMVVKKNMLTRKSQQK